MGAVQLTRAEWDAKRAQRYAFERYFAVAIRPFTCGCDENAAAAERYDLMRAKHQELLRSMPLPRDPLGFAVMHQHWQRRRAQVRSRVLQRQRAAMVREPGEGLMDFISRKCGFVRDEQYCQEARA